MGNSQQTLSPIMAALSADFPPEQTAQYKEEWTDAQGEKKSRMVDYIPAKYITQRLNKCLGLNWSFNIIESKLKQDDSDKFPTAIILGSLAVRHPGDVDLEGMEMFIDSRMQYGTKTGNSGMNVGDIMKTAATDALKKCATEYGVGLMLQESDDKTDNKSSGGTGGNDFDLFKQIPNQYVKECEHCNGPVEEKTGYAFKEKESDPWRTAHKDCLSEIFKEKAAAATLPEEGQEGQEAIPFDSDDDLPF